LHDLIKPVNTGATLKKTTIILTIILFSTFNVVQGQTNTSPISLILRIYPDGSTLVEYHLETEPSDIRIDTDLFGETYQNLIVKDEENNPLDYKEIPTGITIDSIGASEITIIYYTYELTSKEGPLWDLNISSPINTAIYLPQNSAIFDLSDIPLKMELSEDRQYVELPPGDVYVSYILSVPDNAQDTTSEKNNNSLFYIAGFLIIASIVSIYIYKYSKKPNQTVDTQSKSMEKRIDISKIFEKRDSLRIEDREVIKFLSENNGEVFATEIRNRFDMPKSTTWRLIRRLKDLEIVE
jgi:uncharacterized membrane protein